MVKHKVRTDPFTVSDLPVSFGDKGELLSSGDCDKGELLCWGDCSKGELRSSGACIWDSPEELFEADLGQDDLGVGRRDENLFRIKVFLGHFRDEDEPAPGTAAGLYFAGAQLLDRVHDAVG
eukprot:756133-Hanusia_phi.AAC.3